jgi:hypothetical protein
MKYIIIIFAISLILGFSTSKGEGDNTKLKFEANIKYYKYELMNPVFVSQAPNIQMILDINKNDKEERFVSLSLLMLPNIADSLNIENIIPIKSPLLSLYKLQFEELHYNAYFTTLLRTSQDGEVIGFYKLNHIKPIKPVDDNFVLFGLGVGVGEGYEQPNGSNLNELWDQTIGQRNKKLQLMFKGLNTKLNINELNKYIAFLYLTNNQSLLNQLNDIVKELNTLTVNTFATLEKEIEISPSSYYMNIFQNLLSQSGILTSHEEYNANYDTSIDRFINELIGIVNTEYEKINNFKYLGLFKLLATLLEKKCLNIENPTPLQVAIISFAKDVFEIQVDHLSHKPSMTITCEPKKIFYNNLKEVTEIVEVIQDNKIEIPKKPNHGVSKNSKGARRGVTKIFSIKNGSNNKDKSMLKIKKKSKKTKNNNLNTETYPTIQNKTSSQLRDILIPQIGSNSHDPIAVVTQFDFLKYAYLLDEKIRINLKEFIMNNFNKLDVLDTNIEGEIIDFDFISKNISTNIAEKLNIQKCFILDNNEPKKEKENNNNNVSKQSRIKRMHAKLAMYKNKEEKQQYKTNTNNKSNNEKSLLHTSQSNDDIKEFILYRQFEGKTAGNALRSTFDDYSENADTAGEGTEDPAENNLS